MYLQPTDKHWACDIEADDLLDKATLIWCVCVINCVTKVRHTFTDKASFLAWSTENPDAIFVGHNFLAYDVVMLNRFWGCRIPVSRVVDTFVLSQVYNPSYPKPKGLSGKKGSHSLEAWGIRLKYPKTEHTDFSECTTEMLKYCMNDTILTAFLFIKLTERMRQVGFSEGGVELEHQAWHIIQNKQKRNGFPLNYEAAHKLLAKLRQREEELQNEIYKLWPPVLQVVAEYAKSHKANGEPTANFERHREQYPKLELTPDGGYRAYDYVAFNLGSPDQRIAKLLELGWVPTQFTKKTEKGGGGNPKVDEDSLIEFAETSGRKEILALSKWIVINSRANMINTWMEAYNHETKAVHGSLFIASTLRYRHSNPNSANIPAVRLKKDENGVDQIQYGEDGGYSYEARDLWVAGDDDFVLVGIDGTGIQNRCLIHHLIKTVGEERVAPFKALALSGDVHKHNIEVLGLANKAAAKKFYYTLMMGGGGARLAADQAQFGTKLTPKQGDVLKKKMIASMPGFGELISKLEKELDATGRIILSDGTPILVPSPHMVIPYLLQGDESRLMKKAMVYVDQVIRAERWLADVFKVADIHDEWQYKVRRTVVEQFVEKSLPCFNRAGEFFNYLIPIDGDAKIGNTWACTH